MFNFRQNRAETPEIFGAVNAGCQPYTEQYIPRSPIYRRFSAMSCFS